VIVVGDEKEERGKKGRLGIGGGLCSQQIKLVNIYDGMRKPLMAAAAATTTTTTSATRTMTSRAMERAPAAAS